MTTVCIIEGRTLKKSLIQLARLSGCSFSGKEPPGAAASSCRKQQCLQNGRGIPQFTANITMDPCCTMGSRFNLTRRQEEVFVVIQINPARRQSKGINSSIHRYLFLLTGAIKATAAAATKATHLRLLWFNKQFFKLARDR